MEIWLDTCDADYIKSHTPLDIIQGVTTNPAIIRGFDLKELIPTLLDAQPGALAIQVPSGSAEKMFAVAIDLSMQSDRILVKIPTHGEGLKCMRRLFQEQVPFLATAIFTPLQALLAFKAGAHYIAPYVGRMEDGGTDPWDTLQAILDLKLRYAFNGKILAASLRQLEGLERCVKMGLDAVTLRPALFDQLLETPAGLTKALQEWHT